MEVYQSMFDILNELDRLSVLEKEEFKEIQRYVKKELKEKWNINVEDHHEVFRYHELLNGLIDSFKNKKEMDREKRIQWILKRYYPEYYLKKYCFYSLFSCKSFTR